MLRHGSDLSKADAGRMIDEVGLDMASKIANIRRGEEALKLIDESGDAAVDVLKKMDDAAMKAFLKLDLAGAGKVDGLDAATAFRKNVVKFVKSGDMPMAMAERFSTGVYRLEAQT